MRPFFAVLFWVYWLYMTIAIHADPVRDLADAYFRRDLAGMDRLRAQFAAQAPNESAADAAQRHYRAALAEWLLTMSVGGDSTRVIEAARRGEAAVQQAIALDPSLAHAYVLRNRIGYILFTQGVVAPKDGLQLMQEMTAAARKAAPEDPLVILNDAVMLYYSPRGDRTRGRTLLRESIDGLAARATAGDAHAALWLPIAWNWYGTIFLGEGDTDLARDAFESALKVRPDYDFVRSSMIPMTAVVDAGAIPKFPARGWTSLVEDPEGDGRNPAMPDLRAVSWRADAKRIWFRFDLAKDADPERFGVNIALDLDDDQQTGNGWWAGNTAFKYDRLVTVWVRRGTDGKYRGAVGTADAREVTDGSMVTSVPGTITFAADATKIYVGVDRKAFAAKKRVPVVMTVGSNVDWNDTAPATGAAVLELK